MNVISQGLYFIYGVHLQPEQLARCCRAPQALAVARLADFRIDFCGYSKRWDGGAEALLEDAGVATWGVVYALDAEDAERLDLDLAVRVDGTGSYFHYPAEVEDQQGTIHSVLLYMRNSLADRRAPSAEYLARIAAGGKAMGLPDDYLADLARRPALPASCAVPKASTLRDLFNLEHCQC